jgi:hypothetical protein
MQTVFKLPPEASASRTMFVHDFHNGWSSTLLMGQEARMFIWEALLFCSIYMNAGGQGAWGDGRRLNWLSYSHYSCALTF